LGNTPAKKTAAITTLFQPERYCIHSAVNRQYQTQSNADAAYSAGLRISEVVAMKTYNIDSGRMSILIERAKGKKDRMVSLSPVLLLMLREYMKAYEPEPKGYLFAGQAKGQPYSTRSMQLVIASAKQKAGIIKPGIVHALRHSFATHLLDKGTDVTIIIKLLGHNDIRTTLRYLHVINRDMLQIISPLDDLNLE